MGFVFRISKGLHKYLGLVLLLYLVLEGTTGILLNHPGLLHTLSVPRSMIPPSYQLEAWNRGTLRSMIFSSHNPQLAFTWGSQGVWKSSDGGETFAVMTEGFPESPQNRRTHDALLLEEGTARLFAGTNAGLFVCELSTGLWHPLNLGHEASPVRSILHIKNNIVVFTASHAYQSPISDTLTFKPITLQCIEKEVKVPLPQFFFVLHHGKIWGLPGRLLFDCAGLLLIFFSVSGLYMWYFPWRKKRRASAVTPHITSRTYSFFMRYHIKLGIWVAAIFLVIGVTGLFMRPPLITVLMGKNVPRSLYPASWPSNPWHDSINNALYNPMDNTITIETTSFWQGPADFSQPFKAIDFPIDTGPMGSTVFECDDRGTYTVGSFVGISQLEYATATVTDIIKDAPYNTPKSGPFDFMVGGYFKTPSGESFVIGFKEGIKGIGSSSTQKRFTMPDTVLKRYRMPLWSYLFEIHNGRIFRDYIGAFYILIPMVGAFLFLIIILTGIYDWCFRKRQQQP
ncbi:MAG: PepSY domain-containing protein [Candidatus Hydrogenedentes bacterium]|nr:PepSY domain-containing protein [Candidatus Hydrogenedentota bacterium]